MIKRLLPNRLPGPTPLSAKNRKIPDKIAGMSVKGVDIPYASGCSTVRASTIVTVRKAPWELKDNTHG